MICGGQKVDWHKIAIYPFGRMDDHIHVSSFHSLLPIIDACLFGFFFITLRQNAFVKQRTLQLLAAIKVLICHIVGAVMAPRSTQYDHKGTRQNFDLSENVYRLTLPPTPVNVMGLTLKSDIISMCIIPTYVEDICHNPTHTWTIQKETTISPKQSSQTNPGKQTSHYSLNIVLKLTNSVIYSVCVTIHAK